MVLKLKESKEEIKSCICPSSRDRKGITCGTAVGAKQERAKGNKQKAKYQNQERMNEKSDRKQWGRRKKRNRKTSTEEITVRWKQEERERKKQRPSSGMLKVE